VAEIKAGKITNLSAKSGWDRHPIIENGTLEWRFSTDSVIGRE